MKYDEIFNNINKYGMRLERLCLERKELVVYGTTREAFAILDSLSLYDDCKEIIRYIIKSEECSYNEWKGIPIVENYTNTDMCIVILDYVNSLKAKEVIFYGYKNCINIFAESSFYNSNQLVCTEWIASAKTEMELISLCEDNINVEMIKRYVDSVDFNKLSIKTVEIETINRCNGKCSFCPVNMYDDSRPLCRMSEQLFTKIIDDLSAINYCGRLALFSNNEPLLDKRIVSFHEYARTKLPNCKLHLFTNGTLLSSEIFIELLKYLDELIIDNYSDELLIPDNINEIIQLCKNNLDWKKKTTIVLRRQNELLSTRGGEAKNRTCIPDMRGKKCALPFQQMIIRPDGKVSLCCNDPLGKVTLGDVSKQSIVDIWNSSCYNEIRKKIKKGRESIYQCINCDAFHYYF